MSFGQKIIDAIRNKKISVKLKNKAYGHIYTPIYSFRGRISPAEPAIYNKAGEPMRTFFFRDGNTASIPNFFHSKYFLFDRFNIGLNTHFYSHNSMMETMGNPDYKYGMIYEAESLIPDTYRIFDKHAGLEKDFDAVFTYSERLLDKLPNARFFPAFASVWYGNERGGGVLDESAYAKKTANISILSSKKAQTYLHKLRYNLACRFKNSTTVDTFGTFDGGASVKYADTLANYRYSIAIENDISSFYFTERITSCFAAMTIPIYMGAPKIGNFFNPDGIIQISPADSDKIDSILRQCSPADYEARIPAIIDNYNRVKKFYNTSDWLFETYLSKNSKSSDSNKAYIK